MLIKDVSPVDMKIRICTQMIKSSINEEDAQVLFLQVSNKVQGCFKVLKLGHLNFVSLQSYFIYSM